MIVVDASVLVGIFIERDVHHVRVSAWFDEQLERGTTIVLPVHALAEVAGAVARQKNSTADGLSALEVLLATPNLRLVPLDEDVGTAAARTAAQLRLRGPDATYASVAELLDVPLVTLDAELLQRSQSVITVYEP